MMVLALSPVARPQPTENCHKFGQCSQDGHLLWVDCTTVPVYRPLADETAGQLGYRLADWRMGSWLADERLGRHLHQADQLARDDGGRNHTHQ